MSAKPMRLGMFMMPLHPAHRAPSVTLEEDREAVMLADRLRPDEALSPDDADGVDRADDLRERVLIIGFGRFAQVAITEALPNSLRGRLIVSRDAPVLQSCSLA